MLKKWDILSGLMIMNRTKYNKYSGLRVGVMKVHLMSRKVKSPISIEFPKITLEAKLSIYTI